MYSARPDARTERPYDASSAFSCSVFMFPPRIEP
jgi:hypothetical protein